MNTYFSCKRICFKSSFSIVCLRIGKLTNTICISIAVNCDTSLYKRSHLPSCVGRVQEMLLWHKMHKNCIDWETCLASFLLQWALHRVGPYYTFNNVNSSNATMFWSVGLNQVATNIANVQQSIFLSWQKHTFTASDFMLRLQ